VTMIIVMMLGMMMMMMMMTVMMMMIMIMMMVLNCNFPSGVVLPLFSFMKYYPIIYYNMN